MQISGKIVWRMILSLMAFFIIYGAFYLRPVFWNSEIKYNPIQSVPYLSRVGDDFRCARDFANELISMEGMEENDKPLSMANLYPPLFSLLFVPFTFFSFQTAYVLMSLLILFSYLFITVIVPWIALGKKNEAIPLLLLFFILGIYSYPFQFALERGQSDVIAMAFCYLAILLFHFKSGRHWRIFGYLLFAFSVNVKVFPAIFVFAFTDNSESLKKNFIRYLTLGAMSVAMLFSLGFDRVKHFFAAALEHSKNPYVWEGNSSAKSFFSILAFNAQKKLSALSPDLAEFIANNPSFFQIIFFVMFISLMLVALLILKKQNFTGANPLIWLMCTIGALTLPAVSHDYRIAILTGPIAYLLCLDMDTNTNMNMNMNTSLRRWPISWIKEFLLGATALLYFSTGYFWFFKDHNWFFKINFPPLTTILFIGFIFIILDYKRLKQ